MKDPAEALDHELRRALLAPFLLDLLSRGPRHGWGLIEDLTELGFPAGITSAVYRELAKLEGDKLLRSAWRLEQVRGPARHVYQLTAAGRRALARCQVAASNLAPLVEDLRPHAGRPGRPLERTRP